MKLPIKKLEKIQKCFVQARKILGTMTNEQREFILQQHNPQATLQHCLRRGEEAVNEILIDNHLKGCEPSEG